MSQVRALPFHALRVHMRAHRRTFILPLAQVVVCVIRSSAEVVPILVKVQELQRQMLSSPDTFTVAWNFIDAYLRLQHKEPVYRMLRQAMVARRALLLLECLIQRSN